MSTTTTRTIQHRIGGAETAGSSGRTAPVYDPATGETQAEVVLAEREDVDRAVQTAARAFEAWGDVSLSRRARLMFAFRDLVAKHVDDLARIIASEHGKVVDDARGEVIRGLEVVEYACGLPQLLKGEYSDQVSTDIDAYSFRQPLDHLRADDPAAVPEPVDVDLPHLPPLLVGHLERRPVHARAGVVDEHVDRAERLRDALEHGAHVVRVGDVGPHR